MFEGATKVKPKILVFCDFYLPGFRSGGGMWTVVNLVERFCDRYDFHIVTRNHDGRSDLNPYKEVVTNEWNKVGNAMVFYASREALSTKNAMRLAAQVDPDLVFLNSVFSTPVLIYLNARRKGRVSRVPVVIAPCGELSEAALGLKSLKKRSFLKYAKLFGLYRDIVWKATSELEETEIRRQFGADIDVLIAPDLAPKLILPDFADEQKPAKRQGEVKLCFVSRLTRKKNLLFLLQRLSDIRTGRVELVIVGPVEDVAYWNECGSVINTLPPSVSVRFTGAMPQPDILRELVESHFFALPTLNENFGYVFLEAMAAGCPLIISDRTPWNGIPTAGAGWTVELEDTAAWVDHIKETIEMDAAAYATMSAAARRYAVQWLSKPEHDAATASVLEYAAARGRSHLSSEPAPAV